MGFGYNWPHMSFNLGGKRVRFVYRYVLVLSFFCAATAQLRANGFLVYDGDPITATYAYNEYIGVGGTNIYEYSDFEVPNGFKWDVTDIVVDLGVIGAADITAFDWDLRSGMNGSDAGSDLASGTISGDGTSYRTALTGLTVNGTQVYQYIFPVSNSTLAHLSSGQTYWLAIYPVVPNGYNIWLPVTDYANQVDSLKDSLSEEYFSNSEETTYVSVAQDFAFGLQGTAQTPEPAQALPVAMVLLCVTLRIRKAASPE